MTDLIVADHMVESIAPGLSVFVRNKHLAGREDLSPAQTVLCVHGATYPSTVTFDYALLGGSWMDVLARAGFDVWCMDILGYGNSDRPAELSRPAEDNAPVVDTEHAVADAGRVVDYILQQRGLPRLALIGYSWGTLICGAYVGQQPDKVERLVLYGAAWLSAGAAIAAVDGCRRVLVSFYVSWMRVRSPVSVRQPTWRPGPMRRLPRTRNPAAMIRPNCGRRPAS